MPVAQTTTQGLTQTLSVTVTKDLYLPAWKKELKKAQQNAHMKGFRKGKTPMGFVKKMFGQSLLGDAINTTIQSELDTYLKENDITILGQPIASEDQEQIDFDMKNPVDHTFKFDIGIVPKVDLGDLAKVTVLRDVVEIPDEAIEEELAAAQKRMGTQTDVDVVKDQDMVKLSAVELNEDLTPKEGGYTVEITGLVSNLTDDVQTKLIDSKTSDEITFDVYAFEQDTAPDFVHNHLLQLPEDIDPAAINPNFKGTITEIKRNLPAELNEEFFKELFNNEDITDIEGAKAELRSEIATLYRRQSENMMSHEIRKELLSAYKFELPELFIQRWINLNKDEEASQEDLDHQYHHVAEDLTWSLIQKEFVKANNIEVTVDDIRAGFMAQIASYFGGQMTIDPEMFKGTVDKMMENKEQVRQMYERVITLKVFSALAGQITVQEQTISIDDFKDKVMALNERLSQHNH